MYEGVVAMSCSNNIWSSGVARGSKDDFHRSRVVDDVGVGRWSEAGDIATPPQGVLGLVTEAGADK